MCPELATKFQPYDPKNQPKHFMESVHAERLVANADIFAMSCPHSSALLVHSVRLLVARSWRHEKSDIPDVWIDPRDSVIFEIKCYEITACRPNKFSAGYTCRFPRVVQIRSDKDWNDGMSREGSCR